MIVIKPRLEHLVDLIGSQVEFIGWDFRPSTRSAATMRVSTEVTDPPSSGWTRWSVVGLLVLRVAGDRRDYVIMEDPNDGTQSHMGGIALLDDPLALDQESLNEDPIDVKIERSQSEDEDVIYILQAPGEKPAFVVGTVFKKSEVGLPVPEFYILAPW